MFKKLLLTVAAVTFCYAAHGAELTRVVPINPAEAVFAPFWDYSLAEIKQWDVHSGKIKQDWHSVKYSWEKKDSKPGKVAFEMVRKERFSCAGYDNMILSAIIPVDAKLQIEVKTDKEMLRKEWIGKRHVKDEYTMSLNGAKEIRKITYRVFDSGKNKTRHGNLFWCGLQNKEILQAVERQITQMASQPLTRFLAPEKTKPQFRGKVNMLWSAEELRMLQEEYAKEKKKLGKSPFPLPNYKWYQPEKGYRQVLPFANVSMFARVRDEKQKLVPTSGWLKYALITKDPELMKLIARNAVIFALTPNWDSTFLSVFPDSGWDQRVFSHVIAAETIALTLDYASELLSVAGVNLLTKRLATEGLGNINYNVWKYTYLFGNNQLAAFSVGRISSYLVLEKFFKHDRIKPYTDLALNEIFDSIAMTVHEDGSYMEGPAYFHYFINCIQPALERYAYARKMPLHKIIPQRLQALGKFGDAFASTDRRGGMIPVSSGQSNSRDVSVATALFLANLAPESQWANVFLNMKDNTGSGTFLNFVQNVLNKNAALKFVKPQPIAELKKMGVLASTRYAGNDLVKMLIVGTKAKVYCHRHNDRGSFVLEYAGDTYAADPGGQSYSDADGNLVKRSDYHNMLIPANMPDNEAMFVAKADIYPAGKGDGKSFHAEVLPAPSSYDYFKYWKRNIDSPTPTQFTIRDEYQLTKAYHAVRFLWITELPWKKLKDGVIRLEGKDSYALLHYHPAELKFSADDLLVRRKETYHRLNFEKAGAAGVIEIKVELFKKSR